MSRIADTLLRAAGGRTVQLRVATQPSTGDGGQVGLPSPMYQDYPLAPVIFRRVLARMADGEPNKYQLLISATAIANVLAAGAASTPDELFEIALGIVVDSDVLLLESICASQAFGAAYLYTAVLREQ